MSSQKELISAINDDLTSGRIDIIQGPQGKKGYIEHFTSEAKELILAKMT